MDLFGEGERFEQVRQTRRQVIEDRAFYAPVLHYILHAGPEGVLMSDLARIGISKGWWQDTVAKHWGEKMRMLWAYGILTIPTVTGSAHTKACRLVHPAYAHTVFESDDLQAQYDAMLEKLKRERRYP